MTKLNINNLKIAACEQTELNDFGEGIFLEGLQKMIESINQEANLIDVGNDAQAQRIIGLLINRLRFEDDLKKYSEILDHKIISPIVIVGLPRTGSTMTHSS